LTHHSSAACCLCGCWASAELCYGELLWWAAHGKVNGQLMCYKLLQTLKSSFVASALIQSRGKLQLLIVAISMAVC